MPIQVVFKNVERSSFLVEFIEKKSKEVFKQLDPSSKIIYYVEKLANGLKISLRLAQNGTFKEAKVVRSNAYDAVGGALKKMKRQINRK